MRTLYICRHAKSSWADPGQDDHDRPLNERGRHDAPHMARLFAERGIPVDLILSSTATRARSTARCYADALNATPVETFDPIAPRPQMVLTSTLYHPTVLTIQQVANTLPASVVQVMFFGHNPGFTEVVHWFTGEDIGNMPTSGIASITFDVGGWDLVARGIGHLDWLDFPKRHLPPM